MNRILAAFLFLVLCKPAYACMLVLGVGSCGIGSTILPTPSILPQVSSYFNNANGSITNNALIGNGNASGAFQGPTVPTNSEVIYLEGQVSPFLGYGSGEEEFLLGTNSAGVTQGLQLSGNLGGPPSFYVDRNLGGGVAGDTRWWNAHSVNMLNGNGISSGPTLTGFNTGYYSLTMSGAGCARNPTVVSSGNALRIADPGFNCPINLSVDVAKIPGNGGRQATLPSTTCVSNSPTSTRFTVTAHVAIAHGITPGLTFPLQGFAQTGFNQTYTAIQGTSGTTLVGAVTALSGVCPASTASSEGTALSGTSASSTVWTLATSTTLLGANTGVTTRNGQHFCAIVGQNGGDSGFPGSQFFSAVDDQGNPLPGAPALVPNSEPRD